MRIPSFILAAGAMLCACSALLAQADVERFERQAEQLRRDTDNRALSGVPTEQRALIDYGGFLSFNVYNIDDSNLQNHNLRQYEIVGYARLNLDGAQEIYLRGRMGYDDYNDKESFDGHGDGMTGPQMDRAFYRFDLNAWQKTHGRAPSDINLVAEGGRDLAYWGNGLVLSEALDALILDFSLNANHLQLIAGMTPTDTVDIDPNRPSFDTDTRRSFYGAVLSRDIGQHRPYLYGLMQQDNNNDNVGFNGGVTTVYDYNSYYIGIGSTGAITDRLLYGVEVSYEGGNTLSNSFTPNPGGPITQIDQSRDAINAMGADARLDYLLLDAHKSRLSTELIIGSGDSDRYSSSTSTFGGNKPGTSDGSFNAFGLLNTGLAFAPTVSNLIALRVGAATFPLAEHHQFDRLQVGTDFFVYGKMLSDAPIDEPTTDKTYLGCEPDFFLNWQISSDVTMSLRYGIFFPGAAIVADEKPRQFIGAGVTYAF